MPKLKIDLISILFTISLLFLYSGVFAQVGSYSFKDWVTRLNNETDIENSAVYELIDAINGKDSTLVKNAISELEQNSQSADKFFKINLLYLKALQIYHSSYPLGIERIIPIMEESMREAYLSGNIQLIARSSWHYGDLMYGYQQLELAATYCLQAIELYDKGKPFNRLNSHYAFLGEVLFHTHEYKQSIYYTRKGLKNMPDSSMLQKHANIRHLNTIGQGYQQLGELDSALLFFNLSTEKAVKIDYEVWKGINASFSGQVYYHKEDYDNARSLLQYGFETNKELEYDIAGNSLQWLGKIYQNYGNMDSANICYNEAIHLLNKNLPVRSFQNVNFLQLAYQNKAELYRVLNQTDSFYFYNQKYFQLHDSIVKVVALSGNKIAQLRINNEKNQYAFLSLQDEKSKEEQKRNYIIVGISLLAFIIFIFFNRQNKILKYKEELAMFQKAASETEFAVAKEQLGVFTRNLLEKTTLLEKLQKQQSDKTVSKEQQEMLTELSNQTILTEEDWTRFKSLFEKMYPGYFIKLKQTAIDITLAEQRMAALCRLHLTAKEMASILGISVDSVHKTRQRLRQRLQLSAEINLEEYLINL